MLFSRSSIVHREVIELLASPEDIRKFIMTPERILDYYPNPIDGGVLEPGHKIYCRGKAGVSLLELVPEESNEQMLVIKVTTATDIKPPFTEDKIKSARFFTMYEDWQLEATTAGTRLTKTWRDIDKHKMKFLPMSMIVRKSARAESQELKAAWDRAQI